MKRLTALILPLLIAGCGVDGEPVKPQAAGTVTLSDSGAHVGGVLGLTQGPLSLLWEF